MSSMESPRIQQECAIKCYFKGIIFIFYSPDYDARAYLIPKEQTESAILCCSLPACSFTAGENQCIFILMLQRSSTTSWLFRIHNEQKYGGTGRSKLLLHSGCRPTGIPVSSSISIPRGYDNLDYRMAYSLYVTLTRQSGISVLHFQAIRI